MQNRNNDFQSRSAEHTENKGKQSNHITELKMGKCYCQDKLRLQLQLELSFAKLNFDYNFNLS